MQGRHDPFEQMEQLFDQMRCSAFGGRPGWGHSGALPSRQGRPELAGGTLSDVSVTVEENDEGVVVIADVPGFEREEMDLTYDDGILTITGTHEVTDDAEYHRRAVHETVRIPGDVAVEEIDASYRNGVLEVTLPVADDDGDQHRIEIE